MLDYIRAFAEWWHSALPWEAVGDVAACVMLLFVVAYLMRESAQRWGFARGFFAWLFAASPFRRKLVALFAFFVVLWCGAKGWVYIQWDGVEGDIQPRMTAEYDEEFDVSLFALDWTSAGYGSGAVSNTIPVYVRNASSNDWTRLSVVWTAIGATTAEFAMSGDETSWAQWYFGDDPPAVEIETQEGIEITLLTVNSEQVHIEWTAEDILAGATFQIQYRTGSRDSQTATGGWNTLITTEETQITFDRFTLDKFYEWRIAAEVEDSSEEPEEEGN